MTTTVVIPSSFVALDIETTSGNPKYARIVEIAFVEYEDGILVDSWSSLVRPGIAMDPFVIGIHGITNEMVLQEPTFLDIAPTVMKWLSKGKLVITYGGKNFDLPIVNNELMRNGFVSPGFEALDLLRTAQSAIVKPRIENHKLGTVAKFFGHLSEGAHRALSDTIMLCKVAMSLHRGEHDVRRVQENG